MKRRNEDDLIHDILDAEEISQAEDPEEFGDQKRLSQYRHALERLEAMARQAPDDFTARVMRQLPEAPPRQRLRERCTMMRARWLPPLLGAAAATALILALWGGQMFFGSGPIEEGRVVFQIQLPAARTVEVVGTFNNWQPGVNGLEGPDPGGNWRLELELSPGRYEYLFLVNGEVLITDPHAIARLPDGFGRENALLEL